MTDLERRAKSATLDGQVAKKYNEYRNYDIQHGFDGDSTITPAEIKELCFSPDSKCEYCGCRTELGADRIDNTKGHTKDNVVCACRRCNTARGDSFTYVDFKEITQKYKVTNTTFMTSKLTDIRSLDDLLCLKMAKCNREIDPVHVQEIANYMIKNGYSILHNTIFVEPHTMIILSGQHRVSAAIDVHERTKHLVPLEIVFKDLDGDMNKIREYILREENERSNWDIKDFVSIYRDTPEYEELKEFMRRNGVYDYKYIMHILKGISKGKLAHGLDVSDIPTGQKIIDFLKKSYGEGVFDKTNSASLVHVRNMCTALRYFFEGTTTTQNRKDTVGRANTLVENLNFKGLTIFDYAPYFKRYVDAGINRFMADNSMRVPNAEHIVDIILSNAQNMDRDYRRDAEKAEKKKEKMSVRKLSVVAE